MTNRHAGLVLPLSAAASRRSWGVGEFPDVIPLVAWLESAAFDRLMLLPIGAVADVETSPYAALSTMAIDPIYIALDEVGDFAAAGGEAALDANDRRDLAAVRSSTRVRYARIRSVKQRAFDLAFGRFVEEEWKRQTPRATELAAYASRERWWLDDYALYVAIAKAAGSRAWNRWPAPLRDREPHALEDARRELAQAILRQQYLQWIAEGQWQTARAAAAARGVAIFGDLPFMVSGESADAWVRRDELMFDVSLGVPADSFSDEGQDWGLPTYRWPRIVETGYQWIRERARRMVALYDGYRIDHLVGFFRTFGRPLGGEPPFFSPPDEPSQVLQGETILRIFLDSGSAIVAEDLGLVPDFVRASLAKLGVPGSKVLRWERDYHQPGQPFIEPREYSPVSAALTGTHDTATLAVWWDTAPDAERTAFLLLLRAHGDAGSEPAQPWSDGLRDAALHLLYGSASRELFVMTQDLFGWRDRINVPGTIADSNWTWRLPWPVELMPEIAAARERAAFCRQAALTARRGHPAALSEA